MDEIFRIGLHEYLDRMQGRLIKISTAIYKEFCEWLEEGETQGEPQETSATSATPRAKELNQESGVAGVQELQNAETAGPGDC